MPQGKENHTLITAASLDEDEHTIFFAKALAQRLDLRLRLVHCLDWLTIQPWISHYPGEYINEQIARQAAEKALKEASQKAATVAGRLGDDVEYKVIRGPRLDGIISDARAHRGALILAGARATSHRFVPRGISTALSLMGESPLPVMIVNQEGDLDINKPKPRIMVADDLTPDSYNAVATAFAIAGKLGDARLKHVHVHGSLGEQLKDTVQKFWEVAESLIDKSISPGDLLREDLKRRERLLAERAAAFIKSLEQTGGHYEYELLSGQPDEQLHDAARLFQADIVVYGQHQTFHRNPLALGRIPLHDMLSSEHAVLVVPQYGDELKAALNKMIAPSRVFKDGSSEHK